MVRCSSGLVLVACLALVPASLTAQTGISGAWEVTVVTADGPSKLEATFQQKDETVIGQISTVVGLVDFAGALVDGALEIAYTMDVRGASIDVSMYATVTGDSMEGTLYRADLGELAWTARKKPTN